MSHAPLSPNNSTAVKMAPENREAALGTCSFCGEAVEERHVIIQYETAAGELGRWAECPSCSEIVDPISDVQ